ncbi:PREDICTED: uncharacterized protein LOC109343734 isoform X2 [Lupinus angustifolius]|uniref:uncharacterized protein LOC109343734 isoform X2 n=2 Tax=Lupinus angustifolius TaxID=3871 RepID=UPI00092F3AFF|nr:PREDICTED: uncharacterized protein LOC109343734 isoform X2 [Lupinus angustifolius]
MKLQICSTLAMSNSLLHGSRGCLGCFTKPRVIISTDEASKGLRPEGQAVRKDNRSEDLWCSSTSEMDRYVAESQRSFSSVGISSHPSDPQSSVDVQTDHPEFINHGLLWNQIRQQWVGHRKPESQKKHLGEPRISWDATYETLVGSNMRFPKPIPLAEMVEFLVDIWELEGLYD